MTSLLALLLAGSAAPMMVVIDEAATVREEPPPHGAIGQSTAWRISDAVPAPRSFEFRKREIYYVVSGTGIVHSDGEEQALKPGMAAWLYRGARVGIRQTGDDALVLIIAYPNADPAPEAP